MGSARPAQLAPNAGPATAGDPRSRERGVAVGGSAEMEVVGTHGEGGENA